jgi:hypothetical protein
MQPKILRPNRPQQDSEPHNEDQGERERAMIANNIRTHPNVFEYNFL